MSMIIEIETNGQTVYQNRGDDLYYASWMDARLSTRGMSSIQEAYAESVKRSTNGEVLLMTLGRVK